MIQKPEEMYIPHVTSLHFFYNDPKRLGTISVSISTRANEETEARTGPLLAQVLTQGSRVRGFSTGQGFNMWLKAAFGVRITWACRPDR